MTLSKLNIIDQSASLLKSVGHPIRFHIILVLGTQKYMTVTELSELLNVDQPVMSLHLAVLRKKAIIDVKKDGKNSLYSIVDKSIQQIVNIIYNTNTTI